MTQSYIPHGSAIHGALHESGNGPIHNDIILPRQFADLFTALEPSPELRLVIAVFQDAIECATKPPRSNRQIRLQRDAHDWIESTDIYPYSFAWCCDALGFDAGRMRRTILNSEQPIAFMRSHTSRGNGTSGAKIQTVLVHHDVLTAPARRGRPRKSSPFAPLYTA